MTGERQGLAKHSEASRSVVPNAAHGGSGSDAALIEAKVALLVELVSVGFNKGEVRRVPLMAVSRRGDREPCQESTRHG
jgi:hypothetical protein